MVPPLTPGSPKNSMRRLHQPSESMSHGMRGLRKCPRRDGDPGQISPFRRHARKASSGPARRADVQDHAARVPMMQTARVRGRNPCPAFRSYHFNTSPSDSRRGRSLLETTQWRPPSCQHRPAGACSSPGHGGCVSCGGGRFSWAAGLGEPDSRPSGIPPIWPVPIPLCWQSEPTAGDELLQLVTQSLYAVRKNEMMPGLLNRFVSVFRLTRHNPTRRVAYADLRE